MPAYRAPQSDIGRLAFMSKTIKAATIDQAQGLSYVDANLLTDPSAFVELYNAYNAAHIQVESAIGKRVGETAESNAALDKLRMYISHLWISVTNRARRLGLSAAVFRMYKLNSDGSRPVINGNEELLTIAPQIIAGDAEAVAAGFAPVAEPSTAELQAVLDSAIAESTDVIAADRKVDVAQAALAAFRPQADEMIADVRASILYNTRKMDAPSQRRILRSHGATFRYLPNEPIDEGDVAPEVVEPTA
ncbi:MAG: hypothetical protein GY770_36045 [Aestuariibacter sp.]|nr:hypothetical protein [Aestuariibacter sp.]